MARRSVEKDRPSDSFAETCGFQHEVPDVLNIDERIQEMASQAPPFYKNRNLLSLYLRIIPGCLVPAVTLGFDGAMMNGLQAVPTWDSCTNLPYGFEP